MALDPAFIGRKYPSPKLYLVGVEKIREFADSIQDPNPVYRDPVAARAAGHPDVIAPPTFVTIINVRVIRDIVADPDLGLDWSRVVHAEQTFAYHRPVVAGDNLAVVATIENVMTRARNDFLTVRLDIGTADGQPVSESTAVLVARGVA